MTPCNRNTYAVSERQYYQQEAIKLQEKTVQAIYQATQYINDEMSKVIIGKQDVVRKVLMSVLANGHSSMTYRA